MDTPVMDGPTSAVSVNLDGGPPAPPGRVTARLDCCGELDLARVQDVLQDVEELVDLGYRHLHVELDRLRFCDVAGLSVLLAARTRLEQAVGTCTFSPHSCSSLTLLLRVCRLSAQLEPLGDDDGALTDPPPGVAAPRTTGVDACSVTRAARPRGQTCQRPSR